MGIVKAKVKNINIKMRNVLYTLLVLSIASCTTTHITYDDADYLMMRNMKYEQYNCFYIVDTISILHPIVFTINTHKYICSGDIIRNNKIDNAFLKRPDVFLFQRSVGEYYDFMPTNIIDKYLNHDISHDTCHMKENDYKLRYKSHQIPTYRFVEQDVRLTLALINLKYYNMKSSCLDCGNYKEIKTSDSQNLFYKITFTIDDVEYCK